MIVVHACWHLRALHLWGEWPDAPAPARRTGGRPARTPRPRPHPFAADRALLAEALARLGLGRAFPGAEITLHLPSRAKAPYPSPRLPGVDAGPADGEHAAPAPWTVPSIALPAEDAMDFLLSLPAGAADGVVVGDGVRALAEAAKLALELAARGRILPTLEREGAAWRAAWRPVLTDDDDAARLALLRRAFPASCGAADPSATPDDVARGALRALLDAFVRGALRGETLLPAKAKKGAASPGERWLAALAGADGVFGAPLEAAHEALSAWAAPLAPPVHAGLRTCFRLSPPGAPAAGDAKDGGWGGTAEDAWRLDFFLQATDDPSLLVPAGEVWRARGPLQVLKRTLDQPHERLLGDLGRALRLFPPLEPALRTARPAGAALDADAAYRFLREGAPLLAQAGFGVRVPPWWGKPAARLGVKLRARGAQGAARGEAEGRFGLEALVAYDWRVSLGGDEVSAGELRALAAAKAPLVRFRGEWVELRPDEVQAALRLFERGEAGEMTAAELLRLAAGAEEAGGAELPVAGVEAGGWLAALLAGGEAKVEEARPPAGFKGKLRPYQRRGVAWMAFLDRLGVGACLADDMGLGKTVQLLALLLASPVPRGGRRKGTLPTLLVCPMSLVGNWQREAARFAPGLRVHVHHGAERLEGAALKKAVAGSDLVITTYALAARDREALAAVEWGRVVLDEAQNVKNAAARQAQAVRSFRAPRRIALTGTPVENRLSELWSLFEFLNPGLLGSASDFRRRFAVPVERWRDDEAAERLRRLTRPFVLRRLKTDRSIIRDLPAKQEMKVFCNLTREQASLYQATVDEMMRKVEESEGIERRGLVLSTLMKLKQVCNHPAQLLGDHSALPGRSGKLARLEELLDEIVAVGDRALVFTQFAEMGRLLRTRLEERLAREVPFLHGGVRKAERDALVERFQRPDGPAVLLLSLKAGGTGLTLTAASHVIHFDRWWNPAVEDQATDRAFRIGQRRDVQVRKLVCAGTLEERIDEMIEGKKALAASVLGTGEGWLTELSTAELRRVVELSPDAVSE